MIRLFASEFLRARSRGVVRLLLFGGAVGTVVGMTIALATVPTAEDVDAAKVNQRYERQLERCLGGDFFGPGGPTGSDLEEFCNENIQPRQFVSSGGLKLVDLPEILRGIAFIIVLMGLVVGASFVGAEWGASTVGTLVTWEPRRVRIVIARALATVPVAFALAIAVQLVFALLFSLGVLIKGTTVLGGDALREAVWVGLRVGVIAALFALAGQALAWAIRSTAGALGTVLVYAILFEGFLRSLRPSLSDELVVSGAFTYITKQTQTATDNAGRVVATLTPTRGLAVTCVYAVVLMVVAALVFRARDV